MLGEALTGTATRDRQHSNHLCVILRQEVLVRNMELTSHHQREREEHAKGQQETSHVLPTSQNPPRWNPPWLSDACTTRKDPESEWLARDNLETNPITIKPETVSHIAEPSFWVPLPGCSLPGHPFAIKFLALSARVSPWIIYFQVLDKSPLLGPGRGPATQSGQFSHRCQNIKIRYTSTTPVIFFVPRHNLSHQPLTSTANLLFILD